MGLNVLKLVCENWTEYRIKVLKLAIERFDCFNTTHFQTRSIYVAVGTVA